MSMYEYCISKRTSTNILHVAIIYNLIIKILTDICHWCGLQKENKLKRELYLTNYHIKYLYMYKPTWHMLSRISTLYCKLFPLCITWPSVGFGESSLAISDNKIRGFFICHRPKSQDKHNSAFSKQRRSPSIIG